MNTSITYCCENPQYLLIVDQRIEELKG
jgi:hypothetical protein